MGRTQTFYDVRDALAQPGCPVCRLRAQTVERFLDGLLWENVNDPGLRAHLRRSKGFCHEHAWQLDRSGAALGVAIIMRDVLKETLGDLNSDTFAPLPRWSSRRVHEALDAKTPRSATAQIVAQLGAQAPCPACVHAHEREETCLEVLRDHLLEEDGLLPAYSRSEGLCLPHFRQLLALVGDRAVFEALVEAQRRIWIRLLGELSEAIRKSNYQFQDETLSSAEGDAWRRALAAIAGARAERGRS